MLKVIILSFLFALAASASTDDDLRILTSRDMYTLAQSLQTAMLKCKELRDRPTISVEIENDTDELIDKAQLANLVRSMIEGRTPVHPETETPDYEMRATHSSVKRKIRLVEKSTYFLTSELSQADEVLCKKTVKLTKRSSLHSALN